MWQTIFTGKQHLTSDIWEFQFVRPQDYAYISGQYATFAFPEPLVDPRGQSRVMSLTSQPDDAHISFVTRISAHPSPFKLHLSQLQPGDTLMLDAALGDLILPRSVSTPLVFVAGGIGLASFVSMLNLMQKTGEKREIHLLYARRTHEERLFAALLEHFPFASRQEFVSPNRLTVADILGMTHDENALFYLSGTEGFVEDIRKGLQHAGLTDTQIIFDYFTGYAD